MTNKILASSLIFLLAPFALLAKNESLMPVEQRIAFDRDRISRSGDADAAVRLIEFIEKQTLPERFDVQGGPFGKDQMLFSTSLSFVNLLKKNTLDSHWGYLGRISGDDLPAMLEMLTSTNAAERTLALLKINKRERTNELKAQLLFVARNDPLVYFVIKRSGMRLRGEPRRKQPKYGKFKAPLRDCARDILNEWGVNIEALEIYRRKISIDGVQRFMEIFSRGSPEQLNGILNCIWKFDPESVEAKYLDSLKHDKNLSDKKLWVMKSHLHKTMDLRGLMGDGEGGLDRALEYNKKYAPPSPFSGASEKISPRTVKLPLLKITIVTVVVAFASVFFILSRKR